MSTTRIRILSPAEKLGLISIATAGFARRYADQIRTGMTNDELAAALADCFGIMGGRGRRGLEVAHQAAGLKVWGSLSGAINLVADPPLCEGENTLARVRAAYRIPDPDSRQLVLL